MAVKMYGNINGPFQASKIDLFSLAKEQDSKPERLSDTKEGADIAPIKIDISAEGMRALLASKFPKWIDINSETEKRKFEFEHQPVISYKDRIFLDMYEKIDARKSGDEITLSDKKDALLGSFKDIADEISSGYEQGNRIRYVEDESSEDGYRKLTKEEELEILQNDFEELVEERFGEKHRKINDEVLAALNAFGNVMDNSWLKYYEPEKITEEFVDGMLDQARKYIEELK